MSIFTTRHRRVIAAVTVSGIVLAACGGDDDAAEPVSAAGDEPAAEASDPATEDADPAATEDADPAAGEPGDDPVGADDQPAVGEGKPAVNVPDEIPTELVITDLVEGSGEPAAAGDTITLHYVGVLTADGTQFDASWDNGRTFDVTLGAGGVIPGFDQGLTGVTEGGRRQIDIPSELAYGSAGAGGVIPPDAAITFVVDILAVVRPVPATIPERADPSECPAPDGSSEQQREFESYPPFCIDVDATYTAEIVTNFGEFTIELDPARAPQNVNNFVTLARYKY